MGRSHDLPRVGPSLDESADDTGCHILHVDMDAFFVSVETRKDPPLRGKPVIVGGIGSRGVVSAASYEARAFGVHSAMPIAVARRLCPHGVYLPVDMSAYREASKAVMAMLGDVTPLVEQLSVDEAFLDVSGAVRVLGPPRRIATNLRARMSKEQSLTCSVGVATTKFVAKVASTRCKPNGLLVVPAHGVLDFLHPLPVQALWGVGTQTQAVLSRLGVKTVSDIAQYPRPALARAIGSAAATHLQELAAGRDPRKVNPVREEKSIGAENTYPSDLTEPDEVRRELLRLAQMVAARLRGAKCSGRTISIKVRFGDFKTITRAKTLPSPTNLAHDIHQTAMALWSALALDHPRIRLLGIRAEQLLAEERASEQLMFGASEQGWRQAEDAMARLMDRFGSGVIKPATLVRKNSSLERPTGDPSGSSAP